MIPEPQEEGGFNVDVPAIPEVVIYGKIEAAALAMAEDGPPLPTSSDRHS